MRQRLSLLWLPLVAALLARSFVPSAGTSADRGSRIASVPLDASETALNSALPVMRLGLALHPRSPIDRQRLLATPLPALSPQQGADLPRVRLYAGTAPGPQAGTARHFPLFPTGPPSHS
jgi:hypothetical protein